MRRSEVIAFYYGKRKGGGRRGGWSGRKRRRRRRRIKVAPSSYKRSPVKSMQLWRLVPDQHTDTHNHALHTKSSPAAVPPVSLSDKQPQRIAIRLLTRYSPTCSGMTHSRAAIEPVREKLAAEGTRWLPADNAVLAEGTV
ncbi:unnamed protein product [Pleuronectes platessa]|uniref:Uncharacterized protein n=1 Tax=Pleuronectes platessa TaxID=8262 RepID=A0A9N7Z4X5_PLEPL|nr:unnamed protein product [Pleuronectes platessa]